MNLRLLNIGLGAIFLISLASLGAMFVFINPFNAGIYLLVLFSVAAAMFLFSFFSWLGFWVRRKFVTERNFSRILKMVFREGLLLAVLMLVYLWLNHFKLFNVWTAVLALLIMVGAEYYLLFFSGRISQNRE